MINLMAYTYKLGRSFGLIRHVPVHVSNIESPNATDRKRPVKETLPSGNKTWTGQSRTMGPSATSRTNSLANTPPISLWVHA
jgi:hypothetical protein